MIIKQPVDYNVVRADTIRDLLKNVNAAIRDEFEPIGGVTVADGADGSPIFMQAVVKYEYVNPAVQMLQARKG
jgi:hypothetical protein